MALLCRTFFCNFSSPLQGRPTLPALIGLSCLSIIPSPPSSLQAKLEKAISRSLVKTLGMFRAISLQYGGSPHILQKQPLKIRTKSRLLLSLSSLPESRLDSPSEAGRTSLGNQDVKGPTLRYQDAMILCNPPLCILLQIPIYLVQWTINLFCNFYFEPYRNLIRKRARRGVDSLPTFRIPARWLPGPRLTLPDCYHSTRIC